MENKNIQLQLSEKQFRLLFELCAIGTRVLAVIEDEDNPDFTEEFAVGQFLSAHAGKDLTQFSADDGCFYESPEMEENLDDIMREYDAYRFWDRLTDDLTLRDLNERYGNEFDRLPDMEKARRFEETANTYLKEIAQHGINRFRIDASARTKR